jgi:hypothetical protein
VLAPLKSRWQTVEWHALRRDGVRGVDLVRQHRFRRPQHPACLLQQQGESHPAGSCHLVLHERSKLANPTPPGGVVMQNAADAEGRVEGRDSWDSPARIAMGRG